jgi:hypothetical protein
MLECWHFKSDMRPSFTDISEKLEKILENYESKRQQLKLLEMEKLYDYSSAASSMMATPCSVGLTLSNLTPSHQLLPKTANGSSNAASLTNELPRRFLSGGKPLSPSIASTAYGLSGANNELLLTRALPSANTMPPLSVDSTSLMTMLNRQNTLSSANSNKLMSNLIDSGKRLAATTATVPGVPGTVGSTAPMTLNAPVSNSSRQSESEDSQYFSGADTSLVYADSSNMSTTSSSNYSSYSIPSSRAAVKAANKVAEALAQTPPSPPPLKPISKLLNVASAAYNL